MTGGSINTENGWNPSQLNAQNLGFLALHAKW